MNHVEEYKKWNHVPNDAEPKWFRNRGFSFEAILKECLLEQGLEPRSGYKTEGEQIDGSFFLDGSIFLLEAKWHKDPLPASSIYQFKGKVDGKLFGTLGIFISMSGYSKDAVDALTLGKSLNIILFGKEDIDAAILGTRGFRNILKEKLRIAAEKGIVYHSSEVELVSKDGHTTIDSFTYDNTSSNIVKQDLNFDLTSDLVVICEGNSDRELISILITRILNQYALSKKVNIIVAMGKMIIPRVANASSNIMTKAPVLIITDSDNEHDRTLDMLNRGVELDSWQYSIPDPSIETWIGVDRKEFMRSYKGDERKVMLHKLANNINLDELASKDNSFRSFYEWVKNA
ncbi:restriction endonuclease [Pseudoalteromonas sp. 20-92]|uniref:TOPRIM nucleotidyl transferase/hydrolase domain-containing protein n=1 Tax=Pseudoalteromonas sp. 20-92 TaxID=2969394 RepID=UPI0027B64627|nr:TOPRIM nucleotidyl transferase/hydrolase domain-containing protein [Pseudoalteromonas sp. 20-92]MDQ2043559.1 restriction endonuclease [Pseudoalteromonas sp. 20-92]